MPDPTRAQFGGQKYISLETFKKNGQGVRTPVWFVLHNDTLYVYTEANSGKVKRVRNNPQVRVAVCNMRGDVKGPWLTQARPWSKVMSGSPRTSCSIGSIS